MIKTSETRISEREFWSRLRETPEYKAYHEFWKKYCLGYDEPHPPEYHALFRHDLLIDSVNCRKQMDPNQIQEIPLIGFEKKNNPYNSEDKYSEPYFIFGQDTPKVQGITLDQAIEDDLKFLGNISLMWGTVTKHNFEGRTYYSYMGHGAEELFDKLAKLFSKKQNIPQYFALQTLGEKERTEFREGGFHPYSPLFNLAFFRGRK